MGGQSEQWMWLYLLAAPTIIAPWRFNLIRACRTVPVFHRVQLFRRKLDFQPLLNTGEMQHATANLTRPYIRNRPDVFVADEAFVASLLDIFMYAPAET
tara:strand:- start:321 stop:617 length:297 start_codon:yes stop_codon:yes gene_type:complete